MILKVRRSHHCNVFVSFSPSLYFAAADRLVYAEEIFDWTDAYSETYSSGEGEGQGTEEEQLKLQRLRSIGRYRQKCIDTELHSTIPHTIHHNIPHKHTILALH